MVIICSLCGCLPNRTHNGDDYLKNVGIIGKFNVTQLFNSDNSLYIGIRLQDQKAFVNMIKNSPYYRGDFVLKECAMSNYFERYKEKVGNNCFVFARDNHIWLGRFYSRKYFKIFDAYYNAAFELESGKSIYITKLALSNEESQYVEGADYSTPLNWEELKMFFPNASVDETQRAIEIIGNNVKAQVLFDEQSNSIRVTESADIGE